MKSIMNPKKISLETLHHYFLALDSLFSTNLLLPPLLHSLLKKILGSLFVEYVYGETNLDTLVSDWRRFVNYINIYKKIQFRWEKRLIPVDFEEYCHI